MASDAVIRRDEATSFRSAGRTLAPQSVAIVGASERGKWPKQIYANLKKFGYHGAVYLVNPRQGEVFGERCFASLRDLPERVDHAMVIVPAAAVSGVLEDAEAAGVPSATVYAGAVGDGEDPESHKRGAWLKDFMARAKIRIAGPNCMGAHSYRERMFAYPNTDLCSVPPGPVAAIFQSGGSLQFFLRSGADRGLRYSYGISSGNEVGLDTADYLNFLVDDPETRQIVLFIEGLRRPAMFMQAAGRALAAGKVVLAIKTGQTARSQASAASHTGAIAGDYAAFQALCDRYGIINCSSLDDLLETTLAFQCGRRPKGRRLGFVTTSGGTVDLLYDYAESEDAVIAEFAPATNATLTPLLQDGIYPKNPLDAGIPTTLAAAASWCVPVAADPNVDILLYAAQLPRTKESFGDPAILRGILATTDKPVLAFGRMIYQVTPDGLAVQEACGFPYLQGLQPSLRAANALWYHAERQGRLPALPPPVKPSKVTVANHDAELERYGIRGPHSRLARTPEDAAAAASVIGFPVALKIQSADILHKTEASGVRLGLATREAVAAAAKELVAGARAYAPAARIDGFLVQEMVSGVEMIVGVRTDPLYGPMLLVGAGGILVELVKDIRLKLLPVTSGEIEAMLDGLKVSKLLARYRGRPAADRAALVHVIAGLAQFYLDHRAVIGEIEINPLMVREDGCGAVAVDVRTIWTPSHQGG